MFIKGNGCGNTFIIFDCLDFPFDGRVMERALELLLQENRDDALILKKEFQDEEKLVLTMMVLEPDGTIAEFCGNGARVVSCYLKHKFGNQKIKYYLKTARGKRQVWWDDQTYYVEMGKTKLHSKQNRFINPAFEPFLLGLGMRQFTFYWTETMEPHFVTFDKIDEEELTDLGLYLNHHQRDIFPLGVNLNKAEVLSLNSLRVTTFERGVNRITAACGTGSTSCAMLARAMGRLEKDQPIDIFLKAGVIKIDPKKDRSIMSGPANIEL